jgi:DNA modification methylase
MTPYWSDAHLTLYGGDCREVLAELPAESVHCVVTSPPYWGLRDYGVQPSIWDGEWRCSGRGAHLREPIHEWGPDGRCITGSCQSWRGALGLEPTPELFTAHLVEVLAGVRRVLRDDGTLWLNLGDSYAAERGGTHQPAETLAGGRHGKTVDGESVNRGRADGYSPTRNAKAIGLKHKDLVGIPWRVAFALQSDGWYLRSDIIWAKPNPMPESVTDRPTKAHEYLFLLSKSPRYYYDADAVREPDSGLDAGNGFAGRQGGARQTAVDGGTGTTERWRASKKPDGWATHGGGHGAFHKDGREAGEPALIRGGRNLRSVWNIATEPYPGAHFATFPRKLVEPCIKAGCPEGGTVLDPFAGSGTTLLVAQSLGRRGIGIDLNPDYLAQALARNQQTPLGLGA